MNTGKVINTTRIKEGLEEYEWRWKTPKGLSHQRYFPKPLWDGQTSLNGKRILIWCEQGIGDTMNWSSCLSYITSQAEHVILECQEKLVPLLSRSFPNVDVKAEDRSFDAERDDFDLHLPMGSLYKHFIDEVLENKKSEAYLVADPDRVKFWKERLRSVGEGPYVGISWKSSVKSAYRLLHYPPISEWSPVLNVPDVTFINLQYTDYADDIAKVQDEFGVTIHNFDDIDQYGDIDDVAALCTALDMVVSTKVTPPMISAAVGTPTKIANWRQSNFTNILNNPNITSFEMFHKDTEQSWDNVFSLIAQDISKPRNQENISQKNDIQNLSQETIDQLINLYNEGQFLVVVKQARTLTRQYPEEFIVWNILGASLAQMGNFDRAIDAYQQAILLKPDYADGYNNMGVALQGQGKLEKAIEFYGKCEYSKYLLKLISKK